MIVPLVATTLSDGAKLTRVIVLKALSNQMFQLLVDRLGGLLNRRVFYMPFTRNITVDDSRLALIKDLYEQCAREGGVLISQPEHILSFKLMGIDRLTAANTSELPHIAQDLGSLQRWLTTHSRDILDESDEILHVRYQLVYTAGEQKPIEDHPDRWTTTQQVLSLVLKHARTVRNMYPSEVEYIERHEGRFPSIRILSIPNPEAAESLNRLVINDALDGELSNLNLKSLPGRVRDATFRVIYQKDISKSDYDLVKDSSGGMWRGILLLRGLIGLGILVHVLKDRRYRVNYGLDPSRSLLAVPYSAKVRICIISLTLR